MAEEVKKTQGKAETKAKVPAKKNVKKKVARQVPHGCVYVHATFNNTIVTITDLNGNTLAWASSGHCGFKGPKKATPYAAGIVVKAVVEKVADFGLHDVNVFLQGVGSGRDAAVRALNANGLSVLNIKDMTPLPHNGCRPPRARRI